MLEDLKIGKGYDGLLYLSESARNPPKLESHHHVELELNLVIHGTITYVVDDRRYTFPARSLLWLFPAQEHQLVDRSDDAQCYVAVFKPSLIAKSCRTSAYASLKSNKNRLRGVLNTVLEPESFDLIRRTADSLMPGSLDANLLNREAGFGIGPDFHYEHNDPDGLNAGLSHLLLLCWRSQSHGKAFGEAVQLHPVVARALKLLSEQSWEDKFDGLAKACGSSPAHLSRTFHRQIGVPLGRYRNSLRLARFWQHYRSSEQKSLSECVYAAGFGSYSQFYKVFKEAYGSGPRESIAGSDQTLNSRRGLTDLR